MDHFTSPRNCGTLDAPDRVGHAGVPGHGPFMTLSLRVKGDCVQEAKFRTHGCGVTIACGSALSELVAGQTLDACRALRPEDVAAALDGVPPDKAHGPAMAIAALLDALGPDDPGGTAP
jgi:NifU-like protein involved in Fe-S cluster formation